MELEDARMPRQVRWKELPSRSIVSVNVLKVVEIAGLEGRPEDHLLGPAVGDGPRLRQVSRGVFKSDRAELLL